MSAVARIRANPYWNYTDDELLRETRRSPDHLVLELVERFEDRVEEIPGLYEEIAARETRIGEAVDMDAEDLEREWDAERDRLGDEILKLKEQLAHEEGRVAAFYNENQGFLAEIARLKKEGNPTMTTELLEKLLDRLESLETAVTGLTAILTEEPPAPPAPRRTRKAKAVETATAIEQAAEPTPEPAPAAPELTIADLQASLTRLAGSNGAKACRDLVGQYSTTGVLSGVPVEKYPALFRAAEALPQLGAA